MIVNLRYTDDTAMHPFRDKTGREGIAILLFPETKKEKREMQLIRWRLNHRFRDILIVLAKTISRHPEQEPIVLSPEEYDSKHKAGES